MTLSRNSRRPLKKVIEVFLAEGDAKFVESPCKLRARDEKALDVSGLHHR